MLKYAADQNYTGDMLRGLERLLPELDAARVQDGEMYQADDPDVLARAAEEGRIVLTYDLKTVPGHAYDRVRSKELRPGVFAIPHDVPIGKTIDDLYALTLVSEPGKWESQVLVLPF